MTDIKIPGWTIRLDHTSAFVRGFIATPDAELETQYSTSERRGNRYIDAIYPARIFQVRISFRWDEDTATWWGAANDLISIINEKTGEQYKSGWRTSTIRVPYRFGHDKLPAYMTALAGATNPRTTITVTEVPA